MKTRIIYWTGVNLLGVALLALSPLALLSAEPAPIVVQKRGDGSSVMLGPGVQPPLLVIGIAPTGAGVLRIASGGTLDIQSGAIVNFPTGFIPWASVNKAGSSLADLTTRSAGDLSSGMLPAARLPAFTGDATSSVGASVLTLATVNSNAGQFAQVTVNGKGLVTAAGNLSGDLTTSGAVATLATVATGATTGGSTAIPVITFNNKGLVTGVTTAAVIAPAGTLTGTTLAANVVTSSLTSLGTVGTGMWQGTVIAGQYGGTGIANTGKTITLGGSLATAGAFDSTFTMTGATSVTFPTSGTLATVAGTVSSITGTANRITASAATGAVTLDISAAYVGQTSITTLGTIGTGTWQGGVVAGLYGGTGVANSGKTITLGGNLATSGAFATTLTATNTTTLTLPTTGTLATLAGAEAFTNKTYNGNTWTAGTGTLTQAAGSTLATVGAFTSTFTFTGTTGVTFPTSGTLATTAGTVASITGTAGQITASASTGAVTLSIPAAMTGINSITSVAGQNFVLATGTFGTSITLASATGIPTFATHVVLEGVTSTGATGTGNFVFSVAPTFTGTLTAAAIATSGSIIETAASNVKIAAVTTASTGAGAYILLDSQTMTGGKGWEIRSTGTTDSAGAGRLTFTIPGDAIYFTWSTATASFAQTTEATTGGAGSLITAGGFYATKAIISGSTTASTSTTTGSGIFAGGIGVAGAGWFGGNVRAKGAAGNPASAEIVLAGDATYGGLIRGQGSSYDVTLVNSANSVAAGVPAGTSSFAVLGTTASTSTTTGSLTAAGGLGVAGSGYFGTRVVTDVLRMNTTTSLAIQQQAGTQVARWDHSTGLFTQSFATDLLGTTNIGLAHFTQSTTARLTVAADVGVPSSVLAGQLAVAGITAPNKLLVLGYNVTDNYGFIYAGVNGSNYSPLVLQPSPSTENVWIGGLTNHSSEKLQVTGTSWFSGDLTLGGKITTYNGIATAGNGLASIQGAGRVTAQTAAAASVATYTVGAADASFMVSANVLVTASTLHSFTVTCAYTDEGNTARTVTFNFQNVGGTIATAIANAGGAVPYEGVPLHIRAKAATAITVATTGTFTTVTYNAEGIITKLQ